MQALAAELSGWRRKIPLLFGQKGALESMRPNPLSQRANAFHRTEGTVGTEKLMSITFYLSVVG
jgi:hypothetical protein